MIRSELTNTGSQLGPPGAPGVAARNAQRRDGLGQEKPGATAPVPHDHKPGSAQDRAASPRRQPALAAEDLGALAMSSKEEDSDEGSLQLPAMIDYRFGRGYREPGSRAETKSRVSFERIVGYFITKNLYFDCLHYEVCLCYASCVVALLNLFLRFDRGQKWCHCLVPFMVSNVLAALRMGSIVGRPGTASKVLTLVCSLTTHVRAPDTDQSHTLRVLPVQRPLGAALPAAAQQLLPALQRPRAVRAQGTRR